MRALTCVYTEAAGNGCVMRANGRGIRLPIGFPGYRNLVWYVRLFAGLGRFHERFVLNRLPYVPHQRNCLHLGGQRGTTDVFKAHRKHPPSLAALD